MIPHSYLVDMVPHIIKMSRKIEALLKTKELVLEIGGLVVFEVAFFAVADGQGQAEGHEADGW